MSDPKLDTNDNLCSQASYASQWANPSEDVDRILPLGALESIRSSVLQRLGVGSVDDIPFSLILVDGILLFYDDASDTAPGTECDAGVFIHAHYKTLKQRRESRSAYVTKDGIWEDPPGYFDAIVWPNFEKYHSSIIRANPEIDSQESARARHSNAPASTRIGNIAICSSDAPFQYTLEACVETILSEWGRRHQQA
ncbi:ribosylnicotinamide kinase [Coemansia sp. RSA 2706]|nr:ribosylnicotinamide kinase [Coemansia sp. RSA 2706]KAJ2386774.1 ribosylnicotinamide kinase [Coemansia sp. RSA 2611]